MIDVGAGTLWKILFGVIGLLSLLGGAVLYGEHRKQIEWDAALTEQAVKVASQMIDQARNTAAEEVKDIKRKSATKTITTVVEKEVIRYVQTHPTECILTPSFERMFDRISGMLDASGERLPTADLATTDLSVPATAGPLFTCAEVLRAYEYAIGLWREERDRNIALSDWTQSAYQLAVTPRP